MIKYIAIAIFFMLAGCAQVPEAKRVYNLYTTQIVVVDKDANLETLKKLGGIIQYVPVHVAADVKKETTADAAAQFDATVTGR